MQVRQRLRRDVLLILWLTFMSSIGVRKHRRLRQSNTTDPSSTNSMPNGELVTRRGYAVPGYTLTFGNLPFSSSLRTNWYPENVQKQQSLLFSTPEYLVTPLADTDDSPLSSALTDFIKLCKQLMVEKTHSTQLINQDLLDVTLFFRERQPHDPINISSWASEMLRVFRGVFSDQLLLACAVCVTHLVQWLIFPTAENYSKMPLIARPTSLQRLKPHAAWIDLMIFPTFRNALVERSRDWAEPCMRAKWELIWSNPLEDALHRDEVGTRVFLSREFVLHAGVPENWVMQDSIFTDFPEVRNSEMRICRSEEDAQTDTLGNKG